ncbi:2-amino-4-hydroxy-6-hydroxymethyldihydropteridine diphosphokinase [Halobacillus andaensis]|uniref:2-amino-4-hydroxy-6-hydroxymethyldihydropteridine diphosphokinase n=2 Tax=Halobacillus andaensis TaxID=1176239 RepID=A0A917EYZ1_HALAA|nr:2-amino-4-hydroxy-6-hydroxymethyldihydropteridine diphosphokinase [Halobacillus andaensis]GGF35526.1 2-amino-4-hydroxy-6-hydroxymethyldihydropteridine diphosphokinase [Halobacillus andaensis]
MNKAYIALGSNLDEREQYLTEAIEQIDHHDAIDVTRRSNIYETAPVGYTDQNDFLNMVIEVNTILEPLALLDFCQSIEKELGRKRVIKWGPRTIDLDILLYNQENMKDERLTIPHPHMHERAFVMVPLAELNPDVYIPAIGQRADDVVHQLPSSEVNGVSIWSR